MKDGIERCREALMAGEAPFTELIAREGWYCDLRSLRYLSHFITPTSSLIRFTARFFLCPVPAGQASRSSPRRRPKDSSFPAKAIAASSRAT